MIPSNGEFVKILFPDVELLKQFLKEAGTSLANFRYFHSRALDVIKNHLITALLLVDGETVAYGHLDKENEVVWLGICVGEKWRGLGYGKHMLNYLLDNGDKMKINEINLTVDIDNTAAIALYEKFGFVRVGKLGSAHKFIRRN